MPLQIADPQHQLGDGGGARIELDAEELVRVDGVAFERRETLLAAERGQRLQYLALQSFEQFERDIEEIAGAAGRIEHAGLAQPGMEIGDTGDGFAIAALARMWPWLGSRRRDRCRELGFEPPRAVAL